MATEANDPQISQGSGKNIPSPGGEGQGEGDSVIPQLSTLNTQPAWLRLRRAGKRRSTSLRWFWLVVIVAGSVYSIVEVVHHSPWYRQRLLQKVYSANPQEQLRAATTLAHLKCQKELLLTLQSNVSSARELGRRALEHIWFNQAGKAAYQLLQQAHDAMEKKEFQRALAILDRMIDRFPTYAEAWNRRGAVYWELGNYEKSLADSERALALNPNHYGALQGIGVCRLQMGDVAEACRYLRAALKILPYDEPTRRSLERCEELLRIFPPPTKKLKTHDVI